MFKAEEDRLRRKSKEIDCKRSTAEVCKMVLEVYADAVVPTIQEHKVREKVHDLWRMRREALRAISDGTVGKFKKKKKNGKAKTTVNSTRFTRRGGGLLLAVYTINGSQVNNLHLNLYLSIYIT